MNRVNVGDKVKTKDGKVITVRGIVSQPVYKLSECTKVSSNPANVETQAIGESDSVIWGD